MEQQNQQQPPVFNQPQQAPQPAPQYQPRVTAVPMMDPVTAVKTCLKKYFDFKGRARRSEYWWFVLFVFIVSTVFQYGSIFVPALAYVGGLCGLLLIVPQFSAMTRRLHDTGRSGWWVLILALLYLGVLCALMYMVMPLGMDLFEVTDPMAQAEMMTDAVQLNPAVATFMSFGGMAAFVLLIIVFIFTVLDSKWAENKYGPSPKYK